MIHFFKLIRIQNLAIIALTQYLFRYVILIPLMKLEPVIPMLSNISFALLVLSTLLIAAGGYAINDYFDIRIDRINKPDKIIVGKHISRRKTMLTHIIFNIIAVIIGAYVSYKAGSIKLVVILIIMMTILWMYSLKFKSYFFVGNILVAFSTAMTIAIVWIYDLYAIHYTGQFFTGEINVFLCFITWSYVLFSFVISLLREIVKDIEDIEGDRKTGCTTIPVVIGIKNTKYFLLSISAITIIGISYVLYEIYFMQFLKILFWYAIIFLLLPFFFMVYTIITAKNKEDYSFLSSIIKFIMVAGVISMILIFYKF